MGVKTYSKSKDGNTKVSKNFKVKEFACKDGSNAIKIDSVTVNYLQMARNLIGHAITINSGYRTQAYNIKVGGSTNSYHVKGQACDTTSKLGALVLARTYELLGAKGIGYYSYRPFCHVDSRTSKYFWRQDKSNASYYSVQTFLSTTIIKRVQTYLNKTAHETNNKKFGCGSVDGISGEKTQTAFRYFCENATQSRLANMFSYIK